MSRIAILILIMAGSARAQDADGATALRDKATEHWRAQEYAEGVKTLKEAVALYVGEDPLPLRPWAMTMRMLAWHQMRAGDLEGARATFRALVQTLAEKPGLSGMPQEAEIAWRALRAAATEGKEFDKGIALYEEAIAAFDAAKEATLVAQVLHEAGNYSGQNSKLDRADVYLSKAAERRRRIGDNLGYAWSANQLAFWRIQGSRYDDARAPLREAYLTMCRRRLVVPQASIEANLLRVLGELAQRPERDDAAVREWLTELATEKSSFPRVVPRTHLIRALLAWSLNGENPLATVRLAQEGVGDFSPEERADILLQCADAAILLKDPGQARAWLARFAVPPGPVGKHLEARSEFLGAMAAQGAAKFNLKAMSAFYSFDELGDFGGARLVAERLKAGTPHAMDPVVARLVDARLGAGRPGGSGGSASGGQVGDVSRLDLHDPLFVFRVDEDTIVVEDRAGGSVKRFGLAWKPRNVGFNGMSLGLFGPYIVIRSLNYGGGASASGARGSVTLAKLGPYRPLRAGYELQLLRNGAVRYARIAADNSGK